MKKIFTLTVAFAMIAMVFTGCSKEKKLANRLEGTWNIDKFDISLTPAGGGAATPFSFANAGTFSFKDDKSGSYSFVILGSTENGTFTWSNTATTITITENGQNPITYTATTNEKTKQVWTANYTDKDGDQNSETITLTKK